MVQPPFINFVSYISQEHLASAETQFRLIVIFHIYFYEDIYDTFIKKTSSQNLDGKSWMRLFTGSRQVQSKNSRRNNPQ